VPNEGGGERRFTCWTALIYRVLPYAVAAFLSSAAGPLRLGTVDLEVDPASGFIAGAGVDDEGITAFAGAAGVPSRLDLIRACVLPVWHRHCNYRRNGGTPGDVHASPHLSCRCWRSPCGAAGNVPGAISCRGASADSGRDIGGTRTRAGCWRRCRPGPGRWLTCTRFPDSFRTCAGPICRPAVLRAGAGSV